MAVEVTADDRLAFKSIVGGGGGPASRRMLSETVAGFRGSVKRGMRAVEEKIGVKLDSSGDAEGRRVVMGPNGREANSEYLDNTVVTSRYTTVTFLPKFLVESFTKFANTYFLIVSIFQLIPIISITDGIPFSLFPLSAVVAFEGYLAISEDRQRHMDDDTANNTPCRVVENGVVIPKRWKDLRVGDVVKIRNREAIPADLLVLAASDDPPAGVCYVETKSLDGETNLKIRQGIVEIAELVDRLKARSDVVASAKAAGQEPMDRAISMLGGEVVCELPNPHLDKFVGRAKLGLDQIGGGSGGSLRDGAIKQYPLQLRNLLLRGCVLRSTDVAYGLVINAGHDTKVMQSTVQTKSKVSTLDRQINRMLVGFVTGEIVICLGCAALAKAWTDSSLWDGIYIPDPNGFGADDFIIRACTYFLLIANIIPISLYVSMKTIRFCQSFFVHWDVQMKHEGEDPLTGEKFSHPARVRTMDLCDTIGQISFVFSDKTGTLTNNVMEFRKLCVDGVPYGQGTTVIGVAALEREGKREEAKRAMGAIAMNEALPHPRFVNFNEPSFSAKLSGGSDDKIGKFLTGLALCHEVLLEAVRDDEGRPTGEIRLSASSPDDQALVVAASQMGYRFAGRGEGGRTIQVEMGFPSLYIANRGEYEAKVRAGQSNVEVKAPPGRLVTFEMLETLEFTSTRKRMSVIIREPGNSSEVVLYCKGADVEIFKRLTKAEHGSETARKTNDAITNFAADGLRTLTVAWKRISSSEYDSWAKKYKAACADLREMEKRKNKEDNLIDSLMDEMERELSLLGATAIEDKLQERVPETIKDLATAGIKIWVLTGDKQETAINIAWACQLIDHSMRQIVINTSTARTEEEMYAVLAKHNDGLLTTTPSQVLDMGETEPLALVIDGAALLLALTPNNEQLLLKLACRCRAVVCCRVSPKQKAQMVMLCRRYLNSAKTLAIGDGANDVGMIQSADVGVGIAGLEGMQAVNASDVSLGRFYFLKRLLLLHGRNNYRRTSKLVLLILYKNIYMIITQLIWSHATGFSGQKFYFQLGVEAFNLIFTNLPVLFLGIFDKDLPDRYLIQFPTLYDLGLRSRLFNFVVFWQFVGDAMCHAIITYVIMYFTYRVPNQFDIWINGTTVFTFVVFVSNCKIALEQGSWQKANIAGWIFTQLTWPFCAYILQLSWTQQWRWGWEFQGVFTASIIATNSWAMWPVAFVAVLFRDFSWKAAKRSWFPEERHIAQEHSRLSGLPFNDVGSHVVGLDLPQSQSLDGGGGIGYTYDGQLGGGGDAGVVVAVADDDKEPPV